MTLKPLTKAGALLFALLAPLPACADPAVTLLSAPLAGLDGKTHSIGEWNGQIRIVNFWASWCAPCRSEMPLLSATLEQWRSRGIAVIGVAIDNADDVRGFVQDARIAYPMLVADQQGQALMQEGGNVYGTLPYTLLLDRQGKIIERHAGLLDARLLGRWLSGAIAAP